MELFCFRHGETDYNRARLMQGRLDIPLNAAGRAQAQAIRPFLEKVVFDAVVASPLDRAQATASILSGLPRAEIAVDARLTEIDFGVSEGMPIDASPLLLTDASAYIPPEGGESFCEVTRRMQLFLADAPHTYENQRVLLVSHGAALCAMRVAALNLPLTELWAVKFSNCEGFCLTAHDGVWQLSPLSIASLKK